MTDFRPYGAPLPDLCAIPVYLDPGVPAGTAVFDVDPEEPRHVTGIRVHDPAGYELTDDQVEQVRDHYRAMEERASRALIDYRRLVERLSDPVLGPQIAAMPCIDPTNIIRVTGV